MPQVKGLKDLSIDIGHSVARLLNPLSRISLSQAFSRSNLIFNFTPEQEKSTRVWDLIFKDESWFNSIKELNDTGPCPPNPTLIGHDLKKLYYSSSKSAYIALLISDWSGECKYNRDTFFASLKEHDYNKRTGEIHLKHSNIIINIRDAITSEEWLEVQDPRRLFRCHKGKLYTAALYFEEDELHEIGPHEIGKVKGLSTKKKTCIKYICSIRLKFGNGMPVYRVLRQPDIPIKLVNIQIRDENGDKWVTNWRLARPGENGREQVMVAE